jgi:signal transduction histidine kinase
LDKLLEMESIGFGLVISKLLVNKFDGNLMVESKENEGTKITFFLKIK